MNDTTMLESVQFVVDGEGPRSAVLVNLDVWEQIVALLEDLEDADEMRRARADGDGTIPWAQVKADLGLGS